MRGREKIKLPDKPQQEDDLNRELEGTFPASDPPQSTQPNGHIGGPHRPADRGKKKHVDRNRR